MSVSKKFCGDSLEVKHGSINVKVSLGSTVTQYNFVFTCCLKHLVLHLVSLFIIPDPHLQKCPLHSEYVYMVVNYIKLCALIFTPEYMNFHI